MDKMSRTAGSGEPNDSDSFSSKGAAIFLVGGNVSSRRLVLLTLLTHGRHPHVHKYTYSTFKLKRSCGSASAKVKTTILLPQPRLVCIRPVLDWSRSLLIFMRIKCPDWPVSSSTQTVIQSDRTFFMNINDDLITLIQCGIYLYNPAPVYHTFIGHFFTIFTRWIWMMAG